jgi:hypothetical protein
MSTPNPTAAKETGTGAWSAVRRTGRAVARAATRARRRCRPERWGIGLLALALVGMLVGVAALVGLAAVSMQSPAPNPPKIDRLMSAHEAEAGTPDVRADLPCCREPW